MLARQLYLKLTKFTRRSRGTRDYLSKIIKGYEFVIFMSRYNIDAIRRSRHCLGQLASQNINEVSVYGGMKDLTEVLYDLTFEIPIKITAVYTDYDKKRFLGFDLVPVAELRKSDEKVIIASLVAVKEKIDRLLDLGVARDRIITLA
jgi:hypothetical protein